MRWLVHLDGDVALRDDMIVESNIEVSCMHIMNYCKLSCKSTLHITMQFYLLHEYIYAIILSYKIQMMQYN